MCGGGGGTFKGTQLPDNFKDLLILETVSGNYIYFCLRKMLP